MRFAEVRKRKSVERREGGMEGRGRERGWEGERVGEKKRGREKRKEERERREEGRERREGREIETGREKGGEGKTGMKLSSALYQSTKADKASTFALTRVMPENQEQRGSVLVTPRLAQGSL